MDYFDVFDCQMQCEEYYGLYEDPCANESFCTKDFYFEAPVVTSSDDEFERLFDEF